jgi:hypothetical protein
VARVALEPQVIQVNIAIVHDATVDVDYGMQVWNWPRCRVGWFRVVPTHME